MKQITVQSLRISLLKFQDTPISIFYKNLNKDENFSSYHRNKMLELLIKKMESLIVNKKLLTIKHLEPEVLRKLIMENDKKFGKFFLPLGFESFFGDFLKSIQEKMKKNE